MSENDLLDSANVISRVDSAESNCSGADNLVAAIARSRGYKGQSDFASGNLALAEECVDNGGVDDIGSRTIGIVDRVFATGSRSKGQYTVATVKSRLLLRSSDALVGGSQRDAVRTMNFDSIGVLVAANLTNSVYKLEIIGRFGRS